MSEEAPIGSWSLAGVYDAEVRPLMEQIYQICIKHELPFMSVFQIAEHNLSHSCVLRQGHTMPRLYLASLLAEGHPAVEPLLETFMLMVSTGMIKMEQQEP